MKKWMIFALISAADLLFIVNLTAASLVLNVTVFVLLTAAAIIALIGWRRSK